MKPLNALLAETAALHPYLCPRQVLGVRIGMLAGKRLKLDLPQADKRMFTIVETDGCFSDGVAVATGCRVGRRTLRVEDYGKVAATFVDTSTSCALRISPRREARQLALEYAPEARDKWEAMLLGYQRMPDEVLFCTAPVTLTLAFDRIISRPELRAICEECGEEIMNGREVTLGGRGLCASCAGNSYYTRLPDSFITSL
jgi:formylmethanofuran dehydrogenase subunit E